MRKWMRVLMLGGIGAAMLAAQPVAQSTAQETVEKNIWFFEHLLTSVATLSGVQQQDHVQQFKLPEAQGQTLMKVAAVFKTQEDVLRQQVYASLAHDAPAQQAATLAQLRTQRQQLLLDTALALMQQLGPDGASRLTDYIARVNAALPRRVAP
jgi:hypothetical protein